MNLTDIIAQLQSPNNTMTNNLYGQMNLATQGGLADLENVSGSRGWGSRSGVKAGAAADVIGQSREGFAQGMSALEAARMQQLLQAVMMKSQIDQQEAASKRSMWGQILGGIGGGLGMIGGATNLFGLLGNE
jgi:hypothetical protein